MGTMGYVLAQTLLEKVVTPSEKGQTLKKVKHLRPSLKRNSF